MRAPNEGKPRLSCGLAVGGDGTMVAREAPRIESVYANVTEAVLGAWSAPTRRSA